MSLASVYVPGRTEARFATRSTDPDALRTLPEAGPPGLIATETSTIAGCVADACADPHLPHLVLDPMHEAWITRQFQRRTTGGPR
jgi:hypothetical protein